MGSTEPVIEMSTRIISWGLRRPVYKADNLPPSCAVVMKSGNLNFLGPSGPPRDCNGTALTFTGRGAYIVQKCTRHPKITGAGMVS